FETWDKPLPGDGNGPLMGPSPLLSALICVICVCAYTQTQITRILAEPLSLVRVLCLRGRPCGPELHGSIQAGRGDPLAVRAERPPPGPSPGARGGGGGFCRRRGPRPGRWHGCPPRRAVARRDPRPRSGSRRSGRGGCATPAT